MASGLFAWGREAGRTLAFIKPPSNDFSPSLWLWLQALDQERVNSAEDRHQLLEERLEASRAADRARETQLRLAEAVRQYVTQGVPIPFALEGERGKGGVLCGWVNRASIEVALQGDGDE